MEAPQANSELFCTGREGKASIHSAQTGEAKDGKVILRDGSKFMSDAPTDGPELYPARA